MIIFKPIYWSAWQRIRDKLQASTGERRHINTEKVKKVKKKNRDEEKYAKNLIAKNYMTQEHQDYGKILLTILGRRL
jgi:hypothetical protein